VDAEGEADRLHQAGMEKPSRAARSAKPGASPGGSAPRTRSKADCASKGTGRWSS